MEGWKGYQHQEKLFADPLYISRVLGIKIPLNEAYPYSSILTEEILREQLLLEGWVDSVKDYIKNKSKPYKDFFTTLTQIIQDPERIESYLMIVDKNMTRTMVPAIEQALDLMKDVGMPTIREGFRKMWEGYKTMQKSWKRALVGSALYTAFSKIKEILEQLNIQGIVDAIKNTSGEDMKTILAQLPAFRKLQEFLLGKAKDLIGPAILEKAASLTTDIKSYLGWLGPIVGGVDIIIKALSPMTGKMQA